MSREKACKDMEERLVLYHYGELSPEARSDVEAHLAGCGSCMKELCSIKDTLESVPVKVPDAEVVRDALRGVMRAVRHPEKKRRWVRRWAPAYVAAAAAAAAIVLTVYLPDIFEKSPQESQVMAQTDWEMLENFDIARDYTVLEELDSFEALD